MILSQMAFARGDLATTLRHHDGRKIPGRILFSDHGELQCQAKSRSAP